MTVTHSTGIKSFGAYVPRRRLQRSAIAEAHAWAFPSLKAQAKGEKAFCNWDEDAITMAVEAGRDALRGQSGVRVQALDFVSTSAPFSDLQNAVIVGAALNLQSGISTSDRGGSQRAGLNALVQGLAEGASDRLVIGSDKRLAKPGSSQEMQYGSAAGALLIGSGDDLIARFLGSESVAVPFIDHFRANADKFDYSWEERWVRDEGVSKIAPKAIQALLKRIGKSGADVAAFGFSGGGSGADKLVAKALTILPDKVLPDLQAQVGDSGVAQPLLQLIGALERGKPGDLIVIATFAQGLEVVAFEVMRSASETNSGRRGLAGSLAQRIPETAYLKSLSFAGEVQLEWGMRSEVDNKTALTQLYRSSDQIYGFVGGQCGACKTVQFPRMPGCVNCGELNTQKPYSLMDVPARIATFTADWLQYTPAPPLYVGLVQFEVGARVLMEIVDVGPEGIDVGTPLELAFRIKEQDKLRHFDRYFWKAVPVA